MIIKQIKASLPDCPACGSEAQCEERGGYGFFKTYVGCSCKTCELHLDNHGSFREARIGCAKWRHMVSNWVGGKTPQVLVAPNNVYLEVELNCPRCREKIVILRVGADTQVMSFIYPCPHCDEKMSVNLPFGEK